MLKYLLENGAVEDINAKDQQDQPALWQAVRRNFVDIVDVLLKYPTLNINIQNNEGSTPLHCAAALNYTTLTCKDQKTYPKDKTNKTAYVPGKKYIAVQKTNYPSSPSNA